MMHSKKRLYAYIFTLSIVCIGLALRIVAIGTIPAYVDETQLLKEIARLSFNPLPVHFYGFGWGEHVPLALFAWPLINILKITGLIAIRSIVCIANLTAMGLLAILARRWFGIAVALVTVIFASLWPWNIVAGSVGFNVFLVVPLILGAMLCFELYRERERLWLLVVATGFLSLTYYCYQASFFWVPTTLFIYWIAYPKTFRWPRLLAIATTSGIIAIPILLVQLHGMFGISIPSTIGPLGLPLLEHSRYDPYASVFFYHSIFSSAVLYLAYYLLHFVFIFLIFNPSFSVFGKGLLLGLDVNPFSYLGSLGSVTMTPLYTSTYTFVWDVLLIPIGIYALFRFFKPKNTRRFLLLWLFLYPIGSSFIKPDVVAYTITRDVFGLPLLMMLSAYGLVFLVRKVEKSYVRQRQTNAEVGA